jgi:hypothetical protein
MGPLSPSANCVMLRSTYENSEISKNLNSDWINRVCRTHNLLLHNTAKPGTSIAMLSTKHLYEETIFSSLNFNNYN